MEGSPGSSSDSRQQQRQQLLPPSLATCAAILMKINMPLVGVAAYDFDICRHFALAARLDGSRCVCLSELRLRNAENNITIKIMKESAKGTRS